MVAFVMTQSDVATVDTLIDTLTPLITNWCDDAPFLAHYNIRTMPMRSVLYLRQRLASLIPIYAAKHHPSKSATIVRQNLVSVTIIQFLRQQLDPRTPNVKRQFFLTPQEGFAWLASFLPDENTPDEAMS